jgi:HEAT repeat protein
MQTPRVLAAVLLSIWGVASPGEALDTLGWIARLGKAAERDEAIEDLVRMDHDGAPILRAAFRAYRTSNGDAAADIAMGLGRLGASAEEAAGDLVDALGCDERVSGAAAEALVQLGSSAVGALTQGLRSSEIVTRAQAALALGRIGAASKRALPTLAALVSDQDRGVRQYAVTAIGQIEPESPTVIDALRRAATDSDMGVRLSAIKALGKAGVTAPESVAALTSALSDSSLQVRLSAAEALAKAERCGSAVVSVLKDGLRDRSPVFRERSVRAIGGCGATIAAPLLTTAAVDPNEMVRNAAQQELRRLRSRREQN